MGDTEDENREMGIGFGDLEDRLAAHDYPASLEELVAEYGEETLDLQGDDVTFHELIEPLLESGGETFEDANGVKQEILNMVGSEAIGRKGYSDRGGTLPEGTDESGEVQENGEDQSF